MKRKSLYSSARRAPPGARNAEMATQSPHMERLTPAQAGSGREAPSASTPQQKRFSAARLLERREPPLMIAAAGLLALLLLMVHGASVLSQSRLTQEQLDRAVLHTLNNNSLPSVAKKAYEKIQPSVVQVRGLGTGPGPDEIDPRRGIGTGVVVIESGVILTNLHVVTGADRVRVIFANGEESDAAVIATQPESDLAVLKAKTLPDDLVPATLGAADDLSVGDPVIAVGFPFGVGPSATAGVISGLNREYRSPEGASILSKLIQFDAAANPGSSGGPLVNAQGEVVGIVTAILNPTQHRVFIGIGFAVPIEMAAAAAGLPPL
jgi:S1-C subfamily serine protease